MRLDARASIWDDFEPLATSVLLEGHVLYPYRPSALKNLQPFAFGTLDPGSGAGFDILVECDARPVAEARGYYLDGGTSAHVALDPALVEVAPGLWKLSAEVNNRGPAPLMAAQIRCALALGAFCSAQDPRPEHAAQAARCGSRGLYPVLVGPAPRRDLVLAAPIILEDYARVDPRSSGDFCDATEIDDLLQLRVQTLSPAEKEEVRAAGGAAAAILERCEARCEARTARFTAGDRVRLRPRPGADLFNRVLDGRTAAVHEVQRDFDGQLMYAVVADDDPGADLGRGKFTGHRFFFRADEVEPA